MIHCLTVCLNINNISVIKLFFIWFIYFSVGSELSEGEVWALPVASFALQNTLPAVSETVRLRVECPSWRNIMPGRKRDENQT